MILKKYIISIFAMALSVFAMAQGGQPDYSIAFPPDSTNIYGLMTDTVSSSFKWGRGMWGDKAAWQSWLEIAAGGTTLYTGDASMTSPRVAEIPISLEFDASATDAVFQVSNAATYFEVGKILEFAAVKQDGVRLRYDGTFGTQLYFQNNTTGLDLFDGVSFGLGDSEELIIGNWGNTRSDFYTNGIIRATIEADGQWNWDTYKASFKDVLGADRVIVVDTITGEISSILPTAFGGGGGDDWGNDVVNTDPTLLGDGTVGNDLMVDTSIIATQNYVGVNDKYLSNHNILLVQTQDIFYDVGGMFLHFEDTPSAILTIDGGNEYVGIRNASPSFHLDIEGGARITEDFTFELGIRDNMNVNGDNLQYLSSTGTQILWRDLPAADDDNGLWTGTNNNTTIAVTQFNISGGLQVTNLSGGFNVLGTGTGTGGMFSVKNEGEMARFNFEVASTAQKHPQFQIRRYRGTLGTPLNCAGGDVVFNTSYLAYMDGASKLIATFDVTTGSGFGTNNYHGLFEIETVSDGGTTKEVRFEIDGDNTSIYDNVFLPDLVTTIETNYVAIDASTKQLSELPLISTVGGNDITQESDGGIYLDVPADLDGNDGLWNVNNDDTQIAVSDITTTSSGLTMTGVTGNNDLLIITNEGLSTDTKFTFNNASQSAFGNIIETFSSDGTLASPTNLGNNDLLFSIKANAYRSSAFQSVAAISIATGSQFQTANYHSRIDFSTTEDGATSKAVHFRIDGSDLVASKYGVGNKSITQAYFLGVDASGVLGEIGLTDVTNWSNTDLSSTADRYQDIGSNFLFFINEPNDILTLDGGNEYVGIRNAAPSFHLDIEGGARITEDFTFELGIRDNTNDNGSNLQYLSSTGTQILWRDLPSGGGEWTRNGSDIYPNNTTDIVGIGTTNPTENLHIVDAAADAVLIIEAAGLSTSDEAIIHFKDGSIIEGRITVEDGTDRGTDNHMLIQSGAADAIFIEYDASSWSNANARTSIRGGFQRSQWQDIAVNTTLDEGHFGIRVTTSSITITLASPLQTNNNWRGVEYIIYNDSGGDITIAPAQTSGVSEDFINGVGGNITLSNNESLHFHLTFVDSLGSGKWITF